MIKSQRKPLRLKNYDYTQAGAYFVTICTKNRQHLFGNIVVGAGPCAGPQMAVNAIGLMIKSAWQELPDYYAGVDIDKFVVMPNHIHGIVHLTGNSMVFGRPQGAAPTGSLSLPDIIHRFKSLTTARYRYGVEHKKWPAFPGKLWQRNYYEHIIRNEIELNRIRQYIVDNPAKWHCDPENIKFPPPPTIPPSPWRAGD